MDSIDDDNDFRDLLAGATVAADLAAAAALAAVVNPPTACPGCLALAGQPWPEGTTSAYCRRCLAQLRRVWQCQRWNADPAHQSAAGQASFAAFSARWRAEQGLAPLTRDVVRRYVTPNHIRGPLGMPLPARIREAIHRAWCAGYLVGVAAWLSDDPPPEPDGLWA